METIKYYQCLKCKEIFKTSTNVKLHVLHNHGKDLYVMKYKHIDAEDTGKSFVEVINNGRKNKL